MLIKGGVLENKRKMRQGELELFLGVSFLWKRIIGRVGGTCGRKPQTLFWYSKKFKCCFGIFFEQNIGLHCNLDSCF